MKKTGIMVAGTGIIMVLLVVIITRFVAGGENTAEKISFSADIRVQNGEVTVGDEAGPAVQELVVPVMQDGTYELHVKWNRRQKESPGVLTVFELMDDQGNVVMDMAADWVDGHFEPQELETGEYKAVYRYFADEGKLREYLIQMGKDVAKEPSGSFYGFDGFGRDGLWTFDYTLELYEKQPNSMYRSGRALGVFCGVVLGVALLLLMLVLTKKDGKIKSQYDERQEVYRGRAFKYAFFTMLVYYSLACVCEIAGIDLHMDRGVELFMGIAVAIIPFACYSIWKDAYFSLNEKKKGIIIWFACLGIINFLMGIRELGEGRAVVDGRLTMDSISLLVAIDMCVVLAVVFIKGFVDKEDEGA